MKSPILRGQNVASKWLFVLPFVGRLNETQEQSINPLMALQQYQVGTLQGREGVLHILKSTALVWMSATITGQPTPNVPLSGTRVSSHYCFGLDVFSL